MLRPVVLGRAVTLGFAAGFTTGLLMVGLTTGLITAGARFGAGEMTAGADLTGVFWPACGAVFGLGFGARGASSCGGSTGNGAGARFGVFAGTVGCPVAGSGSSVAGEGDSGAGATGVGSRGVASGTVGSVGNPTTGSAGNAGSGSLWIAAGGVNNAPSGVSS
jgi:hypothetical protein